MVTKVRPQAREFDTSPRHVKGPAFSTDSDYATINIYFGSTVNSPKKILGPFRISEKYLLLVLSVTFAIFGFTLIEVGFRLFRPGYVYFTPGTLRRGTLQYASTAYARHRLVPHQRSPNGSINNQGYRGKDFPVKKKEGTFRILIYGGSFVFDTGPQQDWPHFAQIKLHEKGLTNVEVINAGVPNHNSIDSLGRFLTEGYMFEPDVALLVSGWLDIKYFHNLDSLLKTSKPGVTGIDYRTKYFNLFDFVLCHISQIYVRLRHRFVVEDKARKRELLLGPESVQPHNEKQYALSLSLFCALADKVGGTGVLLTHPRLVAAKNTLEEKKKINYSALNFKHDDLLRILDNVDKINERTALETKCKFLDLASLVDSNLGNFRNHAHLTEQGSDKVATLVATYIEKKLLNRSKRIITNFKSAR